MMMLVAAVPQYYEVLEDGLFLRLRWKTRMIPYSSITEVYEVPDRKNHVHAEINLVRITTTTGEILIFGVEERATFVTELLNRCGLVERFTAGVTLPR